ncbi:hypothetical protein DDI_3457 [Dickeya dianthicola RNS04.9]|nr:hypothetical protein DDI_3457 [Dickeya dianthicola RNS04.9]
MLKKNHRFSGKTFFFWRPDCGIKNQYVNAGRKKGLKPRDGGDGA